jgi:hypothetical protein
MRGSDVAFNGERGERYFGLVGSWGLCAYERNAGARAGEY